MTELTKEPIKYLIYHKVKYLSDTLEFFAKNEQQTQDIFKLINSLFEIGKISEQTKNELTQAIARYKFYLIDLLAECSELHIRLYDKNDKKYKVKSNGFYNGIDKENK